MKKIYLLFSFFFCLFLVGSILNFHILFFFKFIIDLFAIGRSNAKLYMFFIYGIICFLLLAFNKKHFTKPKKFIRVTSAVLLCCAVLSLASYFIFVNTFNLSVYDAVQMCDSGMVSSTKLLHIHTLKPVLAQFISFIGGDAVYNSYDAGAPFLEVIPNEVYIAGAVLISVLVILFLIVLLIKEQEWNEKTRYIFVLIYIIVTFSLFKNILDGGPLTEEFMVSVPIFLALLHIKRQSSVRQNTWKLLTYSCIFLICYIIILLVFEKTDRFLFSDIFYFLCFLGVVVFLLLFNEYLHLKRYLYLGITSVLVFSLLLASLGNNLTYKQYKLLTTEIPAGASVQIIDVFHETTFDHPLLLNLNHLKIYSYTINQSCDVRTILDEFHISYNYPELVVKSTPNYQSSNTSVLVGAEIIPISFMYTNLTNNSFIKLRLDISYYNFLVFEVNPVIQSQSYLIRHYIHQVGCKSFILKRIGLLNGSTQQLLEDM